MIVRNTVVEVEDLLAKTLLEPVQISRAIAAVKRGTEKLRSVDADTRADLQNQLANLTEQLEGRRGSQKAGIIPLEEAIVAVGRIVTNHEQCRKLIQSLRELEG